MRRPPQSHVPVSRGSNPLSAAYRGVAQLFLTSISASLADQRRTDETIQSRLGEPPAGSSGALRSLRPHRRLSAVLLRGSLSALNSLGSIPWAKPSRSCCTIQVLFFVPGMWTPHGGPRMTTARAMPERSCRAVTGSSPVAAKSEVTAPS